MRTLRSMAAMTACGGLMLAFLSWQPADAATSTRNTFRAQCFHDSPAGKVRVWWTENQEWAVLGSQGEDGGTATDGKCATVPASVSWMAVQAEEVMGLLKAQGLPMPPSDKGVQRLAHPQYDVLDDGSGAFDIFVDGSYDAAAAEAECRGYAFLRGGTWKFGAIAKLYVHDMSASIPPEQEAGYRAMLAHEFVHVAQCAVTNPRRFSTASDLQGPWIEAVPNALAAGLEGGSRSAAPCTKDAKLLSPSARLASDGYGQWPFWYSLLEAPTGSTYTALLRDVMRAPVKEAGPQLARAIRKRFTDKQISQALLTWATSSYFGGTLTSASGVPISTRPVRTLNDGAQDRAESLTPPAGGAASAAMTIPPLACAAVVVPWPDGAETLTVSASGTSGRALGDVMAAGLDVSPGAPPTARCGAQDQRTVVPLTGNQFTAARPCTGTPQMWLIMVNGGASPLTLTVNATAS